MDAAKLKALLLKKQSGQLTDEEKILLDTWYLKLSQTETVNVDETDMTHRLDVVLAGLEGQQSPERKTHRLWRRIAAAASILLCLSTGLYFYQHQTQKPAASQIAMNDIAPGSNRATLTLANGQKIVLDTASSGKLASQGSTVIQKSNAGAVIYTVSTTANQSKEQVQYNTLTTKRGEQYPLVLADGTKVWLNSASSITYPVAFNGSERKVTITGEAYFEVVHNEKMPFRVSAGGQTIEDLGTHFNINAYADEEVSTTTLLEGSIKVNGLLLKPGQQSDGRSVREADLESAIAWKNGLFRFDNLKVQSLMRQLARWYDIEVEYQGTISSYEFAGEIRRNTNLSNVLKILEQGGIHFRVEGRKLIVTP